MQWMKKIYRYPSYLFGNQLKRVGEFATIIYETKNHLHQRDV